MKSGNPSIEWSQISGKQCLRFTFGEQLTLKEAEVAIEEWREAFGSVKDGQVVLIWDCRKMRGYESAARNRWTDALKEMKPQIDVIWLMTDSILIKMGASVMGMISSIKIKPISSETEIVI